MNIGVLDLATGTARELDFFYGANNLNPEHDDDGNIYFLSDRDGFRNMYRYEIKNDKIFQMTNYLSGISGITEYSPALSVSRKKDKIVYSYYAKNAFTILTSSQERFINREVDPTDVDLSLIHI